MYKKENENIRKKGFYSYTIIIIIIYYLARYILPLSKNESSRLKE